MTVHNVIQILVAADKSQTHDMKRYALNLIVRHLPRLASLPQMKALSKELLLDILQALAEDMGHSSEGGRLVQDLSVSNLMLQ